MDTNTSKTSSRNYFNIPPIPRTVWTNPLHFIAFGFGSGTIPFAPGTFGTLIAIPFYLALQKLSPLIYLFLLVIIIIASIYICAKATRDIGIEDHQGMCLDEIVGFLVTMALAPKGGIWILLGFLLFRFFDIWKPWPISIIDNKVSGGLGIILDDVLAGIYSFMILQLVARIFH
jgi:phosphatidylglycerophosphatase A